MLETNDIIRQVLQNCCISNSRNAGFYSVCGLALRLRDLYKWEKGLDPWVEEDSSVILKWIGDKEENWNKLAEKDFDEIAILDSKYDPFDTRGVNGLLEPHGLYYGAGYGHSLRPTFFLARIEDKKEMDGALVYILGRELARDLLTMPALCQDNCVVIRKESAKLSFWDQIIYVRESGRPALKIALEAHGLKEKHGKEFHHNLARVFAAEIDTYIFHELGEIHDTVFDRDIWREVIATFPHTPIELLARTVKDLLADTNEYGRLRYITRERKTASLGFYVAFLDGLTKEIFPELIRAFKEFSGTRNWHVIEQAVSNGYNTAKHYAETICRIYETGRNSYDMKWTENEIEKRLLSPLGLREKYKPSQKST